MTESISTPAILADLGEWQIRNLSALTERRVVPCGTVVVRQGDPGEVLFILMSGQAEVQQAATPSSERKEIAILHDGEFFGEVALLTGGLRSATVVASTELDLLCLSRGSLRRLQENAPSIASQILWNLSRLLCERMLAHETSVAHRPGMPSV